MPIYVYHCQLCDKELEVLQKHTDPAPYCEEHQEQQMSKKLNGDYKFTFTNGKGTSGGHTIR